MDKCQYLLRILELAPADKRRCLHVLQSERARTGGISESLSKLSEAFPSSSLPGKICAECEKRKIEILCYGSPDYPEGLYRLAEPPVVLFRLSHGGKKAQKTCVAVVGSRKADREGIEFTKQIVSELRAFDITIVSGLAYGIDAASHWGALSARSQVSSTDAVLAGGLDAIYPRANEKLAEAIMEAGGSLISEYPPFTAPRKHHFLERNRIVAALSQAVVVVQASSRSGSLSTAGFAAEMGIDVFSVPGPITSELYAGNHRLIQSGAFLLTSPSQILEHLGCRRSAPTEASPSQYQQVVRILEKNGPMSIEELKSSVPCPVQTLLELEASGRVEWISADKLYLSTG